MRVVFTNRLSPEVQTDGENYGFVGHLGVNPWRRSSSLVAPFLWGSLTVFHHHFIQDLRFLTSTLWYLFDCVYFMVQWICMFAPLLQVLRSLCFESHRSLTFPCPGWPASVLFYQLYVGTSTYATYCWHQPVGWIFSVPWLEGIPSNTASESIK